MVQISNTAINNFPSVELGVAMGQRVDSILRYLKQNGRTKFADIVKALNITVGKGRYILQWLAYRKILIADYTANPEITYVYKHTQRYIIPYYTNEKVYEYITVYDEKGNPYSLKNPEYLRYHYENPKLEKERGGCDTVVERRAVKEVYYTINKEYEIEC